MPLRLRDYFMVRDEACVCAGRGGGAPTGEVSSGG